MEVDSYFLVSMSIIQCQVRLNRLRKLVYICTRVIPIRLSWRENSMDLWFWFNVISYVDASLLSYLVYVYISKKKYYIIQEKNLPELARTKDSWLVCLFACREQEEMCVFVWDKISSIYFFFKAFYGSRV